MQLNTYKLTYANILKWKLFSVNPSCGRAIVRPPPCSDSSLVEESDLGVGAVQCEAAVRRAWISVDSGSDAPESS
jgi:hypothetical protein